MIVRIAGEGQFRLPDEDAGRLNELDNRAVAAVEQGDELGDDDLDASDVILPPSDLSFVEAGEEFTGDGLIPEPA